MLFAVLTVLSLMLTWWGVVALLDRARDGRRERLRRYRAANELEFRKRHDK